MIELKKYVVRLCCGFLVCLVGCQKTSNVAKIYISGHVVTMDEAQPEAEAFAIQCEWIKDVGTTLEMRNRYPNAEVVDLGGKTVMPGIVESHGHLLTLGKSFLELNVVGVPSPEAVVDMVRIKVKETPPGEWITGWGWDEGEWAKHYPDNVALSLVSPDNPVYLNGLHGFACWANEKALEIAGITSETEDFPNGKVIKDPVTGKPTGILTNEAQALLTEHIPPLTQDQIERALVLAHEECLRNGLTTIHEARTTAEMLEAFRSLKRKGALDVRIYCMLDVPDADLIAPYLKNGPEIDPDHLLTIRCNKVFVDGALGSRGAVFMEDYTDAPGVTGVIVTSEEDLYDVTVRSLKAGMQVATHGIGDLANRMTLNAYRRAIETVPTAGDHRLRLEHAQVTALEDIPQFAPLGIVLSMQPPHATSDMGWAEDRVGPRRINGAYAWRTFLDTGVHLTLNSDFPGETLNPFHGMYAAETRQSPDGKPEGGWYPEQCLTREEVLRAYTIEAAYSGFEEDVKGQIKAGMLADFIVLSQDIQQIPSKELLDVKVLQTVVGGKLKFESGESSL